ncbi:MAG: DUF3124 domain-containing protein [Alsobacter sp.]
MRWTLPALACLAASLAAPDLSAADNGKALEAFQPSLTAVPAGPLPLAGSLYVPVYSTVALNSAVSVRFTVTLSIRNVSEQQPLVVRRIAYFDTGGKPLESYLAEPVAMKPMATVEVTVPVTDSRGGSGANFIIEWAAPEGGDEPLVEALMLGNLAGASYSFTSAGRPIRGPSR